MFTCADKECGFLFHWIFYHEREQLLLNTKTSGSAFDIPQDLRYLAAKGPVGWVTGHVSVLVAFDAGFSKLSKRPVTLLEVIEPKAMDTGMVTVKAGAMAKGIDATGHIAIYGVYFDTNSAEIKPESSSTLEEISKLLQGRPSLKLQVVGQAFSNPRMSLKSVRAEKGRLQGEDLLSERIEGFERGGGQGGGGSCAHSCRDHEDFLELPLPPPLNVESGAVRPR